MHKRKPLRPLILVIATCFSLTAQADPIEGQWKGTLKCGPLLVTPPSPEFSMPISMTVTGKEAVTTRETDQYKEQTRGSVDGGGAVSLTGEGRYKAGNGTPWATRFQGQFTGNRFTASGGIFGLDGTKRRECNVDLTQVAASTLTGTVATPAIAKAVDTPTEAKTAYPYSNSYDVVTSLADGRTGKIAYQTLNRSTTINDLQSGRIYKNDTAQAILSLPTKGKAPYPVMVIAHSSAGVQPKDHDWVKWFNDLGVATLLIDTFTPRGIGSSASNQSVLSYGATIGEYLLALKLLETHPAIDIKRAGIIGFSRGGVAAMATGIESLRKGVIGGDLKYAVHFPVYGGCYFRAERWTGAPMHLLVGTEDSYENIDVCEGWKEHAKGKGIEADLTLFSGVHHGFDDSSKPELRNFPNAEKWKPCKVEWNIDTHQFRTANYTSWHADNNMGAETATCSSKGVTVKYDVEATNQLKQKVESTLKRMGFLPDASATPIKGTGETTRVTTPVASNPVPASTSPTIAPTTHDPNEVVTSLADGRIGKISYQTLNRKTTIPDLQSGRIFMNESVTAVLNLPSKGQPPYPVMVIAHSSAGVTRKDHDWAEWFNQMGIATLLVDTFSPRGIANTASDQSQLTYGASAGEYLVALKLLATHPKLDMKRVGIIGFSRGASAATGVAIESVRRGAIGGDLKYAIHFPIYGGCAYRANRWTGAPVHMFVGTEDSWEDLDACREWKSNTASTGIETDLTVFNGVHHGYDNPASTALRSHPNAENWRPCKSEWNVDTRQIRTASNNRWHSDSSFVAESDQCKARGATTKYDDDATRQTKQIIEGKLAALGFVTR